MIAYRVWLFVICGLMLAPQIALAQRGLPTRGAGGNSSTPTFDEEFKEDTLDLQYFYQDAPKVSYAFDDTLLTHFHEFDISRLDGPTYLNLGIPGSPVRPLIPSPGAYTGFSPGLESYVPYYIGDDNFRFYRSKKAITQVFYTKGQSQNDGVLRTSFGRSFKDRIQLSLDYNRYTNFGIYSRQAGRNTNLGVGLGYESKNQRLLIFASHYSNIFTQQHNGGITTDTLFNADFSEERTTIPTYLANAATRDDHKSFKLNAFYQLFGKDSIKTDGGLWVQYVFRADNHYFKFTDTRLTAESTNYYGSLLTDSRGIRNFLEHNRIVNDISLNLGNVQNRELKAGLRNILNNINQEPVKSKITEWKLYGDAKWNFADRLLLNSQAELNINRENASFLVSGMVDLNLGKAGHLTGRLAINQQQPTLIESRLFVNQIEVWNNDFKNIFINHLEAKYQLPDLNFHISGGQILAKDEIYFNQSGYPVQQDGLSTLTYLEIFKAFRLGPFVNQNKVTLQKSGNNPVFRIPDWYSQHSLDFNSILFKSVLDFKAGFDLRLNDRYLGYTYLPLIGQFAVEDQLEIPLYPALDFRTSFRVKYFRAFAIFHNVLQPLRSDVYFQTSRYPYPDFYFRLGISWIFIN